MTPGAVLDTLQAVARSKTALNTPEFWMVPLFSKK
jgi:hypothetical protein